MIVNPIYGAGGGAPSMGYVADKLAYYYEGSEEKLSINIPPQEMIVTPQTVSYAPAFNTSDGWTLEAYFQVDGTTSNSWQGVFGLRDGQYAQKHADFYIGDISDSTFKVDPYITWGGSIDDIISVGMTLGEKYTVSIVSIPDPAETEKNTVKYYADGVQFGENRNQNRDEILYPYAVGVEQSSMGSRPMNGKLYNGRFYSRALTAAEIAANHAVDIAKYGGNS